MDEPVLNYSVTKRHPGFAAPLPGNVGLATKVKGTGVSWVWLWLVVPIVVVAATAAVMWVRDRRAPTSRIPDGHSDEQLRRIGEAVTRAKPSE